MTSVVIPRASDDNPYGRMLDRDENTPPQAGAQATAPNTPPEPTTPAAAFQGPQEPQPASPYGAILDREQQQSDRLMLESFHVATKQNPKAAREANRVAAQLGMDPYTAERNPDEVRRILAQQEFERADLARHSPALAQQMRDPEFARQASDEWKNLSAYERTLYGFEVGRLNDERGLIGGRMWMGAETQDDVRRLAEINARLQQIPPSEGFVANAAEIAGGVTGSLRDAVVGAGIGGTAALVAGQLGPQVALPEEVLTVPAGMSIGAVVGFAGHTLRTEAGQAYVDLLSRGVAPGTARWAASGVGAVNLGLELAGARFVAAPFRATIRKAMGETLDEALVRPTLGKAAARTAIGYVKAVGGETGTELLQEVSNIVAEGATTGEWEGVGKRLGEVAIKTAQGMALLGIPGAGMQLAHESGRVRAAQRNAQQFERMQEHATASALRTDNPDAFQKFADDAAQGTGAETVYIDAAQFAQVLRQGGKADAEGGAGKPLFDDLDSIMPGFSQGVLAEAARGGDIAMPSSVFLTKFTGTDVGKALTPHVRFAPDDLSAFDAEQVTAQQKEMEQQVTDQAERIDTSGKELRVIEETLAAQVEAAGRSKSEARTAAKLWAAFVRTQSERLGESPAEFQKANDLTVGRGEDAEGALRKEGDKETRGFFDPATLRMTLTDKADSSTFAHEGAHAFLSIYDTLAQQKANPTILDDFRAFLGWAGESEESWGGKSLEQKRAAHEKFAESFEAYLHEGKAPTPALQRLFDKFMGFLRAAYALLRGADADPTMVAAKQRLTPEIRAVMDRMLASDEQVRATQAIRGAVPLFQTEAEFTEAGGTPEQWQAIQAQQQAAQDEASASLTTASLAVMRWLSGAKGKALRALQRQAKEKREAMRGEVAKAVQAQPVYRAARWLRTGERINEDGTHTTTEGGHKIQTADVEALGVKLPGMTSKDGMPADDIAATFGYESGEQMVRELADAASIDDAIESGIDARMLAENAALADPRQRELAVEKLLHGPARQRFVAAELRALSKSLAPERVLLAAAKEAARVAIGNKRVADLTPRNFSLAAQRASKASQQAMREGDLAAAVGWKRRQMLQSAMFDEATRARQEIAKAEDGIFAKLRQSDEKLSKGRAIDLIYAAQALAAAYRLGPRITGDQRTALVNDGLAFVRANHPIIWQRLAPLLDRAKRADDRGKPVVGTGPGSNYRDLSVEDFRELVLTVEQLWNVAGEEAQLDAEGKAIETEKGRAALSGQLGSLPPRPPITRGPEGESAGPIRERVLDGMDALAGLKIMEHVARFLDGGKEGPFFRFLVAPMMRGLTRYRDARRPIVQRLATAIKDAQKRSGALWHARIHSRHLGHTFRGKVELLGALLHAGSHSNLEANLVGRGWGEMVPDENGEMRLDTSRWDAAIQEFFDNGILNKQDVKFLETWWDTFAKLLPEAQKTHKKLFGHEFETIELRPLVTPWGVSKGGYVPKRADRYAADPRMFERPDALAAMGEDFRYSVGAQKGFTLERDPNYRPPLTHNVTQLLGNVDEELRFIHLQPVVSDIQKLLRAKQEKGKPRLLDELNGYDRSFINGVLMPWLQNTVLQRTSTPSGSRFVDWIARAFRNAATLVRLGLNLGNALVQVGGIANAASQVDKRFVISSVAHWLRNPRAAYREMIEKSRAMQQRFDEEVRKLQEQIGRAAQGGIPAAITLTRQVAARWAFMPQRIMQMVADVVTWHAGYNEAIAAGKDESAAIESADAAVRRAQGSREPESQAAYAASTPLVQTLTQFGNYSNLVLNQNLAARGHRMSAFAWTVLLPAAIEAGLITMLYGDDKDDDDEIVDDVAANYGATLRRNLLGLVPVAGPMMNSLWQSEGMRVQESPAVGFMKDVVRGAFEAADMAFGDGETTEAGARSIAAMLSFVTGLPLAAPVRTTQQMVGEPR